MNPPSNRSEPAWVAGIDGCRAGWIVALAQVQGTALGSHRFILCSDFNEVLHLDPAPIVIAVDMPIGLLAQPEPGGRLCDRAARRLLGRRSSSVFSPPSRLIIDATHYDEVRQHGMSRQAFGILPKIREIDHVIVPAQQDLIYEAHPELAFAIAAGTPMTHNKKTAAGREERLRTLSRATEPRNRQLTHCFTSGLSTFKRKHVAADDLLDAIVLTRTAYRIATAQATCLPPQPPIDARGLRMEIWA